MSNTTQTQNQANQPRSPEAIVSELKQEFCKKLDALAYSSSYSEVFRSWVEIAAITLHQLPYHRRCIPQDERFETMEARYLKRVAGYERETLDEFAALLGLTITALNLQWSDFLGTVYTEMEISGKKSKQANGEFFTPYPLAQLNARMILQDCEEVIERQGYITISEPACGAGSMLIAACEVIAQKGYAPEKVAFFEAVDNNPLCCHMAFVQFAALELSGIVCHGDTLKYEFWERWATPSFQVWHFLTGKNPFLKAEISEAKPTTPTRECDSKPTRPTIDRSVQLGLFKNRHDADEVV
jgi:N-6 DNA Methylase